MNDHHKLTKDMNGLIACIDNVSIRYFTSEMAYSVTFPWQRPASRHHHLQDERESFGNLLHSVRVASICRFISYAVKVNLGCGDAAAIVGGYSDDVLLSASLLHDMNRHGLFCQSDTTQPDHPKLVRQHAIIHGLTCEHFNDIMSVIESHMGKWSDPPVQLSIDAHTALHLADCIVARWAEVMPSGSKEDNTID